MQLRMKVVRVTKRTETVTHRGKEATEANFEDVELEAVSGDPFLGSAAGAARFTIDNPAFLGQFVEGAVITVALQLK